ncbi:MAG: twin-arginine translocation signal domain-containing protein, partial [Planctomycetota bacterium]
MAQEKNSKINRRNFLKTMGAVGAGSCLLSAEANADPNT